MEGKRIEGEGQRIAVTASVGVGVALLGNFLLGNGFALRTPDQKAYADFEHEQYQQAAKGFSDAQWRGVAYFRAGDFKEAANVFSGIQSADGYYNYGNALVMLGKYQAAVEAYDRALALGEHADASANRAIAEALKKSLDFEGGNMTDGKIGADGITFEQGKGSPDQDAGEEVVQGAKLDDAQMREVWLRKVQTKPADFLKVKFMYQDAARQQKGGARE